MDYTHAAGGLSIIGGFVYRGTQSPELSSRYIFGDFSAEWKKPSGQIYAAKAGKTPGALWSIRRLLLLNERVHSLGEDAAGELYVLTTQFGLPMGKSGKAYKIVPSG